MSAGSVVTKTGRTGGPGTLETNLLLSKEALVNSKPALEIFADDVKCRHGSTIGQLDDAAMFYLRSRGIHEKEARDLLVYAFASDVASRIRAGQVHLNDPAWDPHAPFGGFKQPGTDANTASRACASISR